MIFIGWSEMRFRYSSPAMRPASKNFLATFFQTSGGATRDYFYARRGAGPDERWMPYDSGMKAAVRLDGTLNHWEDRDHGWTAEVAIPWLAFEKTGGGPKPGDCWTFMVSRYDYSVYQEEGLELSATSVLPSPSYHLHEYYRDLLFCG